MRWWLKHKKGNAASPAPALVAEGYFLPESSESLLAADHRKRLLERIWQYTALSQPQFDQLYLDPIHRYAKYVQQLPASESHHHAYPGGMLDHGLELMACSLKLRQSYLLPSGAAPEDQAAQTDAWSAAIAYGALLHDIGKIAVDLQVEYQDGDLWHPWHGPLNKPYRFRYVTGRDYQLHAAAAGLLYTQILTPRLLDWLSGYPTLWGNLLSLLANHYEYAATLGELVLQADRVSTAQNIGANPTKAVWSATVSDQGWQHRFTLLRLQPSLIWADESRPRCFEGTVELVADNTVPSGEAIESALDRPQATSAKETPEPLPPNHDFDYLDDLMDMLQETVEHEDESSAQGLKSSTASPREAPGLAFVDWLSEGIQSHRLLVNDCKAKIHTVDGTFYLVTPGIFQLYVSEHPELSAGDDKTDAWRRTQRHFEHLGVHHKRPNGQNIWTCTVQGPRRRASLNGYMLQNAETLLSPVPTDNPFLNLTY
ncbi:MobH family relaxase [Pseudomonas laurylsulfatiphila]